MGLGKTLQSICILAGDHYYRDQKYKQTKSADCAALPSLVVCPPTLTGVYEIVVLYCLISLINNSFIYLFIYLVKNIFYFTLAE